MRKFLGSNTQLRGEIVDEYKGDFHGNTELHAQFHVEEAWVLAVKELNKVADYKLDHFGEEALIRSFVMFLLGQRLEPDVPTIDTQVFDYRDNQRLRYVTAVMLIAFPAKINVDRLARAEQYFGEVDLSEDDFDNEFGTTILRVRQPATAKAD